MKIPFKQFAWVLDKLGFRLDYEISITEPARPELAKRGDVERWKTQEAPRINLSVFIRRKSPKAPVNVRRQA